MIARFNLLNYARKSIILFYIFLATSLSFNAYAQLAFPTAKGAGAFSIGGRGGAVVHVTNLNDSGPGSFRDALGDNRTIVFDVSGVINLTSGIDATINNVTIAGQTAPGQGITFIGETVVLKGNNIIVRYLRFRGGTYNGDAFNLYYATNTIVDHCSFSFGQDEAFSVITDSTIDTNNVTVQNCFFAESTSGGGIVGDGSNNFMERADQMSYIENTFYNISHRFPNVAMDGRIDIINNVVWNMEKRLVRGNGSYQLNQMNNYYDYSTPIHDKILNHHSYSNGATPSIYSSGNRLVSVQGERNDPPNFTVTSTLAEMNADNYLSWKWFLPVSGTPYGDIDRGIQLTDNFRASQPFPILGASFPMITADEAKIAVPNNSGAFKSLNSDGSLSINRDQFDTEWLDNMNQDIRTENLAEPYPVAVLTTSSRPTDYDTDLDGMADEWELATFSTLNNDGTVDSNGNGYTDLEDFLNQVDTNGIPSVEVTGVEVTPPTATINIPETVQLIAEVLPDNATNQNGIWSTSDASIATVNNGGVVTPVAAGTATITFTTSDGGFTDTSIITVTNIVIPLESVAVTPDAVTMDLGENYQLNIDFAPVNTTDTSGTWTSSDETVAVVSNDGLVSSVSEGSAIITFTANDGGFSDSSTITVVDDFYGTYQLYNADTDIIIHDIVGDDSINLGNESSGINFRSIPEGGDVNPGVESVEVVWTGPTSGIWVESDPLYAGLPNGHVGLDFEPYIVEAGTYNFTVTYYSNNGASGDIVAVDNFSLTFFFSTLPVANAGPDQDICEGETVTLTASGGPNFLWDTGETTASIEVSPTTTTTYTVTVFDNDGNFDEDSVVVTVNPIPVADAGEDQDICEGETVTLTASGGTDYLWSTGETTEAIQVSPTTETIYTVEVSTNNCSSTDSVTVFVNEIPNITVSDDVVLVEGGSTTLGVTGSDNYLWSTGETTPFITVSPLVTTTYTVTSISTNGCSSTEEVTVTVIPEVVADAGNDVTICAGENVTLTATGGVTYLWDTGDTTAEIIVAPTVTTTYTVTVEDDYGYTDSDSVTITVNETPDITVSDDVAILEGETVTLSASGGDNYLWSTGDTTASITVTPTATTTYTVVSTAVGGCADIEQVTVTIIPEVVADAGEDVTICSGESTTLNATGGSTYLWNTGDTTAQLVVSPSVTTTYTVTVEDDYGYTDEDSVTVTVIETPDISVSDDIIIFEGESTTLTASGGNNYLWNTGETSASITVSPSVTTTYTVVSSNGICEDLEEVTVTVIPEVIADAGEDVSICSGESVTLTATGGTTYVWNTGETTAQIVVSPSNTTTYSVTVGDDYGNTDSDTVTVSVTPSPQLTLNENTTIIEGDSITLAVDGADTYLWNTGETTSSIVVSPSVTTIYTVTGTIGNCSAEAQVTITVEEPFVVSAGSDEHVCEDDTYEIVLTATAGDSYLWSTGETTQSIVVSPLSTTTYTVTVTQGTQEATDEVTIYVDPNPDVVILNGESVDIMSGDFVTLSATGANTYEWDNGATQPNIAVSPSQTTTYEVRGYIGDCYDEKQVTVNVIPEVIANAGEDVDICLGEVVTLTASGGDEYFWSTGEETQSIQVSPNETTEYTVTVFNALDFDEDSVTVYVDDNCVEDIDPGDPGDFEPLDFEFSVYPNPSSDIVNVRLAGSIALSRIYLYDITGKLIYSDIISNENLGTVGTRRINVSELHPGMYYLKLVDVRQEISKKIMVK
ncbi:Ig-like domain-containing protein [Winogradskyella sp.]|uniref:T9SS type A sorting domain-containing protein n=1 Tax=Winogradskyella sp. TaxID=1883156 RepID=UPI003BAB74DA